MWAQKILASSKLRPYKLQVIPLAILGVVYYAMTRTGPKNWSKKKKNHENKQGDLPLEAAPSQPTSRLMSKTQKAIHYWYCVVGCYVALLYLQLITHLTLKDQIS